MALDFTNYFSHLLSTLILFECFYVRGFSAGFKIKNQMININQYIQYQLERLSQFDNIALSLKSSALVAFN